MVFLFNILGATIAFAALATRTDALNTGVHDNLVRLGTLGQFRRAAHHIFWSGVIGGWIICPGGVDGNRQSLDHRSQIAVIWLMTFVVGIGHFSHCIASSGGNNVSRICGIG